MAALSIYMKNKPILCLLVQAIINLFVKCGNCDQICCLVYSYNLAVALARAPY